MSCTERKESHQYRGDRSQRVKKAVPFRRDKDAELFRAIHVGDQEKILSEEAIKETESSIRMQPPSASTIWLPWRLSADFQILCQ